MRMERAERMVLWSDIDKDLATVQDMAPHMILVNVYCLEHFQKYCSRLVWGAERAVFLGFGFVSAQLQVFLKPAPSPKPRQNPKILAPNGCTISSNALAPLDLTKFGGSQLLFVLPEQV